VSVIIIAVIFDWYIFGKYLLIIIAPYSHILFLFANNFEKPEDGVNKHAILSTVKIQQLWDEERIILGYVIN